MPENNSYRLGEYKITENVHGNVYWETHFGLGASKRGKGFIRGDILFIAPNYSEAPGFLKGEFLDHLKKLPLWTKTKYYCASYRLLLCPRNTESYPGKRESRTLNPTANATTHPPVDQNGNEPGHSQGQGGNVYKVGRYEIIETDVGGLFWRTYGPRGRTEEGRCIINDDILFIGPAETEKAGPGKKQFMLKLTAWPEWERTRYYCPKFALYHCGTGAICRGFSEGPVKGQSASGQVAADEKSYHSAVEITSKTRKNTIPELHLKSVFGFCKQILLLIPVCALGLIKVLYKIIKRLISAWVKFRALNR